MDTAACGDIASPRKVAVVIPSFRAAATIGDVLKGIGPVAGSIYVVDDACPEATGERVLGETLDPRVTVLRNARNLGVGGAMKHGYRRALADGADIIVKIDADGQMDPRHIERLIAPIVAGTADYTKGNRFAQADRMPPGTFCSQLGGMPQSRRVANRLLSLVHRFPTGYWHVDDPANGYTAIHARALQSVGIRALSDCFFFETDMLFRLSLIGAKVAEVPLPALYPGRVSSLKLRRVAFRFARLILMRSFQRLWHSYLARGGAVAGVCMLLGLTLMVGGGVLGLWHAVAASTGGNWHGPAWLILGFAIFSGAMLHVGNARVAASWRQQVNS